MTAPALERTTELVAWLLQSSLEACVLIGLVLASQAVLRDRLSARWKHALWLLLLARLLVPWSPSSAWSVYNVIPRQWSHALRSTSPTPLPESDNALAIDASTVLAESSPATACDDSGAVLATGSGTRPLGAPIVAGGIWLAGALGLGGLILWRSVAFGLAVRRRPCVGNAEIDDLMDQCKRRIGCRREVRVLETPAVSGPALFGIVRPCVLLPSGTIRTMDRKRLRHVFLHELAHLRRHDLVINWLATVLQVVHWFNPLVWYALGRMRTDRELACDALVLARLGADESEEYGRTLVYLFERFRRRRGVVLATGFFGGKSLIRRRVEMIANFNKSAGSSSALALGVLCVLACVTLTEAQEGADAPTDKANLIVPGVGVGPFTLGMSKDDVLQKLGKPKLTYWGSNEYTLDDLPIRYRMRFEEIQLEINYNEVQKIMVLSPSHTLVNGFGVGEAEESVKRTFGKDFHQDGNSLIYEGKGLEFHIGEENETVDEICVTRRLRGQTIVPGVGIGAYTLGMSKDDVLKKLGKPILIYYGHEHYTLDNLPTRSPYRLHFGHITCEINDNAVRRVTAHSPIYKFDNGLGVGDSEDKIKQAFGSDFDEVGNQLSYDDKGVQFEINEKKGTVNEVNVYRAERE